MKRAKWKEGTLKLMEKEWEARAQEDAMYYIATREKPWSEDDFFEEGKKRVHYFTDEFFKRKAFNPEGKRMLDIGCGIGRMDRGFAEMFAEVWGIDVSEKMIQKAKELNKNEKIKFIKGNGRDLSDFPNDSFHFVFSIITFQHIPEKQIIFRYFSEIYRILKPGGLFKVHLAGTEGIARAFGFIPVPRYISTLIPYWAYSIYERIQRTYRGSSLEKLEIGRSWRGTRVSKRGLYKKLSVLKFSKLEFLEDTTSKGGYFWCCGRK
jgi:ubiquinone/menaquinone biosynthesis C-methylase UbiE